jgi:hypothetical protein
VDKHDATPMHRLDRDVDKEVRRGPIMKVVTLAGGEDSCPHPAG